MPILKHAKKKLKQDKKRTIKNRKLKDAFKSLIKKAKEEKSTKAVSLAFSAVDKAAKKNILSKNKAAHMKSSLSKHVSSDAKVAAPAGKSTTKTKKTAPKTVKTKSVAKTTKSSGAKKTKPSAKK